MKTILLLLISAFTMIAQQTNVPDGPIFDSTGRIVGYQLDRVYETYEYDAQGRLIAYGALKSTITRLRYNDDGSMTKTLPDGSTVVIPKGK